MNALSRKRIDEIKKIHAQIASSAKRTIELAIQLGALLAEAKETLNHGEFLPWVEQNMPFSVRDAQNYMRAYREYATRYQAKYETVTYLGGEDPDQPLLPPMEIPIEEEHIREVFGETAGLTDLYVQAGIKKILHPPREKGLSQDEVGPEQRAITKSEVDRAQVLDTKPHGDFPLELHCVLVRDGEMWAGRRDREGVWPLGFLTLKPEAGAEGLYEDLMDDFQLSLEKYYSRLEDLERQGVIEPPTDYSIRKRLKRTRQETGGEA